MTKQDISSAPVTPQSEEYDADVFERRLALRAEWQSKQPTWSLEEFVETELLNERCTVQSLCGILNDIFGLVYPDDPTTWEYPGQVFNHVRIYIEELKAQIPAQSGGAE